MADITSSTKDDLESKPSDNEFTKPTAKKVGVVIKPIGKLKIKAIGFGKSAGIGTRKSTSAPKGFGQKKVGQTKAAF